MNHVVLHGRLTANADLRYTQSGKAVATFQLAVPRSWDRSKSDFFRCVIWDKRAENLATYTKKGVRLNISGVLQSRTYEKDNQKVYITEVLVREFDLIDRIEELGNENKDFQTDVEENPFGGIDIEAIELSDDDLPF